MRPNWSTLVLVQKGSALRRKWQHAERYRECPVKTAGGTHLEAKGRHRLPISHSKLGIGKEGVSYRFQTEPADTLVLNC